MADFNYLSSNGVRDVTQFHPLIPLLLTSDDKAAIIAIQITLFPNQGFSIGITTHHAVLDGKSSTMFIKSWAYICKQGKEEDPSLLPELTPCFDRSVITDPTGIDMVYVNNWLTYTGFSNPNKRSLKVLPHVGAKSNWVRATVELTREDIKYLRNKVLSIFDKFDKEDERQSKQLHLSTFVLSCAYIFVCIIKARRDEDVKDIVIGFVADYRSRLNPPIPMNYVGNCVMSHWIVAKVRGLKEENGVAFLAKKLSEVIKGIETGVLEGTAETLVNLITVGNSAEGGVTVPGRTNLKCTVRISGGEGRRKWRLCR